MLLGKSAYVSWKGAACITLSGGDLTHLEHSNSCISAAIRDSTSSRKRGRPDYIRGGSGTFSSKKKR